MSTNSRLIVPDSVCLVDPSESVRRSLVVLLGDLATIHEFESGEPLLDEVEHQKINPAILISECDLPGISGLRLFLTMQEYGWGVPTILLATQNDIAEAVSAIRSGVREYYEKPFDAADLRRSVELILQH